ncbi:oligomeric golgi complex component, COG2-domain-containing protein [Gongronella butleri]|nr:oligomeric golgi complex component, COG2-domain-containing protein [Gongronella butleri]
MFGDDDDTFIQSIQPLPTQIIERSVFHADQFDPDRFLSSRRHLGLERLKTELNAHRSFLKNELIELINRDYQDFINLSTNMRGVDHAIRALKMPLTSMEGQVKDAQGHFDRLVTDLETQLDHRAAIRDRKTSLKLLLNIHDSVEKVEELLEINKDTAAAAAQNDVAITLNDDTALDHDLLGKQIERVAVEYNQMQHLVSRGKHLAFVTENEWRITRIKEVLQQKLSKALSSALQKMASGTVSAAVQQSMTQSLRIYALIDQTHVAEQIIRDDFVRHFLKKIIHKDFTVADAPAHANGGTSSSPPPTADAFPLTAMYSKILLFASNELKPILDITQHTLKGTNYEVLVNALWVEVVDRINRSCAFIYAAGQTDACHKNYTASVQFITELENLFNSKKSLLYFRSHASYATFMKRWQLPVYFQLRFREIIHKVEEQLSEPSKHQGYKAPPADNALVLNGTKVIAQAIESCWSDHVFLFVLSHRFWKLTLQLISRYKMWALELVGQSPDHADEASSPVRPSTPSNAGAEPMLMDEALIVILISDIERFVAFVKKQMSNIMFTKLPSDIHDVALLKESMDDLLDNLESNTSHELDRRITGALSRRCMESFKHVRDMINQQRMNKQRPTEPSFFIPSLFKPLTSFLAQHRAWIAPAKVHTWSTVVVDMVVFRYTQIMSKTLDNLKLQDDTMKNIRWKGGLTRSILGSSGANASLTDIEKIQLQFVLDVHQLGTEIDKLEIEKATLDCYTKLCSVIQPYEHLLTGTAPPS